MVFYREYLRNQAIHEDVQAYSFCLGYHCHLVSDLLWSRRIGSTTQRIFGTEIKADGDSAWDRIKDDWYGLDQLYNRENGEGAFWRVIHASPDPPSYLPFLNEKALHQQLAHIRDFYGSPEERWFIPRPYPYLNEASMSRMVIESVEAILLLRTYLAEMRRLDSYKSSAELLPPKCLRPYPAPLGDTK